MQLAEPLAEPWLTLWHAYDKIRGGSGGILVGGVLPNDTICFRTGAYDVFWDGNYWRISPNYNSTNLDNPGNGDVYPYWGLDQSTTGATPPTGVAFTVHGMTDTPMVTQVDDPSGLPEYFTNPQEQQSDNSGAILFYNNNHQLVYDLTYCDPATKTLYFRSNEVSPITDPSSQLYVGNWYSHLQFDGDGGDARHLTLDGITFNWGSRVELETATHMTFENCAFQAATLYGGGSNDNLVVSQCYFDCLGGREWRADPAYGSNGQYNLDGHDHDIYLAGAGMSFHDNFVGRNRSGMGFALNWGTEHQADDVSIFDNVFYGSGPEIFGGGTIGEDAGLGIHDNVIISRPAMTYGTEQSSVNCGGWKMKYVSSSGQRFYNNYVEVVGGPAIDIGTDGSTESNISIDNNVIVEAGVGTDYFFIQAGLHVTFAHISGNKFIGNGDDHGGYFVNPDPPPYYLFEDTDSYALMAYLNDEYLTEEHQTENSFEEATGILVPTTVEGFLDGNPALDAVMEYFRQYASDRGWTESS